MFGAPAYSPLRKVVHWLCVAVVATAFAAAWGREAFSDVQQQLALLQVHRVIGVAVFLLFTIRSVQRLMQGRLPPPASANHLQALAADCVHATLYAGMLTQPIVGWLYMSARGKAVDVLGLFQLPQPLERNLGLAANLGTLHDVLGFILAGLVVLHVSAVIYHTVFLKDRVLHRMLWLRGG
jgi:cytochrome b561